MADFQFARENERFGPGEIDDPSEARQILLRAAREIDGDGPLSHGRLLRKGKTYRRRCTDIRDALDGLAMRYPDDADSFTAIGDIVDAMSDDLGTLATEIRDGADWLAEMTAEAHEHRATIDEHDATLEEIGALADVGREIQDEAGITVGEIQDRLWRHGLITSTEGIGHALARWLDALDLGETKGVGT